MEKDSHSAWSITNLAITSKHKQSSPSNPDTSSDTWFHELHSASVFIIHMLLVNLSKTLTIPKLKTKSSLTLWECLYKQKWHLISN